MSQVWKVIALFVKTGPRRDQPTEQTAYLFPYIMKFVNACMGPRGKRRLLPNTLYFYDAMVKCCQSRIAHNHVLS